jgi:hypothetical protein
LAGVFAIAFFLEVLEAILQHMFLWIPLDVSMVTTVVQTVFSMGSVPRRKVMRRFLTIDNCIRLSILRTQSYAGNKQKSYEIMVMLMSAI